MRKGDKMLIPIGLISCVIAEIRYNSPSIQIVVSTKHYQLEEVELYYQTFAIVKEKVYYNCIKQASKIGDYRKLRL